MSAQQNPEIGTFVDAGGIRTNHHEAGEGKPVILIHGSGPGVSAWANWRMNIPELAKTHRVLAPDLVGFGFTDRPDGIEYGREVWVKHLADYMDALGIDQADIVGNSFGGGLALAFALEFPERVRRICLMGSVGVSFELTPGLDAVWGYEPSVEAMRGLLDIFAYDRSIVTDELATMRYEASIQPGFQESFSAMFPAPRQNGIESLASPEEELAKLPHPTLIIHGREDDVIPVGNALKFFELLKNSELHLFGNCGHWTQIEHAARFNMLLADFMS